MGKYFLWMFIFVISTAFAKPKSSFQQFTGKILGNKVRVRTNADLDSKIIKQLNKDDLVLIIGDEDEFWSIQPFSETKAYVFRSYVIDNTVEANRVNVRLAPDVEAPVIGQLKAGDKVVGKICNENHKWLEIPPPKNTKFYVSKEFISYAGPSNFYDTMSLRRSQIKNLLDQAYTVFQEETKMPFDSMSPKNVVSLLEKIINEYSDFPNQVYEAKKLLVGFKENYLEKKLAYMEEKQIKADQIKDEPIFPKVTIEKPPKKHKKLLSSKFNIKGAIKFWDAIETSLYENWLAFHNNKELNDFYNEQKADAIILDGIVSPYNQNIQNRPGDFVLKDKNNVPLAFLYSTKVDLEKYNGKQVKILGAPRPNNHFAYPAYFVIDIR